jgi:hypothetical protein
MKTAKTVASVSFLDNRSISMDVESVVAISVGIPIQVDEGQWFCELIVRSTNGTVAMQLLADSPERFAVEVPEPITEDDI